MYCLYLAIPRRGPIYSRRQGSYEHAQTEPALRNALAEVQQQLKDRPHAEDTYLRGEIRTEHNFEKMFGNDPALVELLQELRWWRPARVNRRLSNGDRAAIRPYLCL